ncbi:fumarylacetoacetate hydrolase family protein [Thermodesulfobacteriota bacterium]
MRIARVHFNGKPVWGIETDGVIELVDRHFEHLSGLLQNGLNNLEKSGESVTAEKAEFLSPVTSPCNILCQGKNYSGHRVEIGAVPQKPDFNLIFTKADSSLTGPKATIVRPSSVRLLDYEVELGLVIGKRIDIGTEITKENWSEYVAGLVIANDISARDVQLQQGQWFKGKSYRDFCPVGPYLVPLNEYNLDQVFALRLKLYVNGQPRQDGTTADLLFKPHETLSELSQVVDLQSGDLLLTGTPGGVALQAPSSLVQRIGSFLFSESRRLAIFVKGQLKNPRYLKNGDSITASIKSNDGLLDLGTQDLRISAS